MSGTGAAPFAPLAPARPIAVATVPADTEEAILRLVVREFPSGGPEHESAIRMALQLGFAAGHHHPERRS